MQEAKRLAQAAIEKKIAEEAKASALLAEATELEKQAKLEEERLKCLAEEEAAAAEAKRKAEMEEQTALEAARAEAEAELQRELADLERQKAEIERRKKERQESIRKIVNTTQEDSVHRQATAGGGSTKDVQIPLEDPVDPATAAEMRALAEIRAKRKAQTAGHSSPLTQVRNIPDPIAAAAERTNDAERRRAAAAEMLRKSKADRLAQERAIEASRLKEQMERANIEAENARFDKEIAGQKQEEARRRADQSGADVKAAVTNDELAGWHGEGVHGGLNPDTAANYRRLKIEEAEKQAILELESGSNINNDDAILRAMMKTNPNEYQNQLTATLVRKKKTGIAVPALEQVKDESGGVKCVILVYCSCRI